MKQRYTIAALVMALAGGYMVVRHASRPAPRRYAAPTPTGKQQTVIVQPSGRPRCAQLTNGCPPARSNLVITCDPLPVPEMQWCRLWASTNANMQAQYVWGTNRTGYFKVPLTNSQLYFVLAVVDEALPYDSAGRKR